MKQKKKGVLVVRKSPKKGKNEIGVGMAVKTNVTTKEKSHPTIEDHETKELKKNNAKKKGLELRNGSKSPIMRNSLSPFSHHERLSFSPKFVRNYSPSLNSQVQRKKESAKNIKSKEKRKEKPEPPLRQPLKKANNEIEKVNQSAYERLFLRRLDEKRITEMSEEQSSQLIQEDANAKQQTQEKSVKSHKASYRDLKQKILEKYRRQLPNLKMRELKFLCCIVMIQRLWRQRRTKHFISDFIMAKRKIETNISADSHRITNKLDITLTTQENTAELLRKYNNLNITQEKKLIIERQHPKFQLKDLEICKELTPEGEKKMLGLMTCMRDIKLQRKNKEGLRGFQTFHLRERLSEKCLMQSFYEKIFKPSVHQDNFKLFSQQIEERNKRLLKKDNVEVEKEMDFVSYKKVIIAEEKKAEDKEINRQSQSKPQNSQYQSKSSLRQLAVVADEIVSVLLAQLYSDIQKCMNQCRFLAN